LGGAVSPGRDGDARGAALTDGEGVQEWLRVGVSSRVARRPERHEHIEPAPFHGDADDAALALFAGDPELLEEHPVHPHLLLAGDGAAAAADAPQKALPERAGQLFRPQELDGLGWALRVARDV